MTGQHDISINRIDGRQAERGSADVSTGALNVVTRHMTTRPGDEVIDTARQRSRQPSSERAAADDRHVNGHDRTADGLRQAFSELAGLDTSDLNPLDAQTNPSEFAEHQRNDPSLQHLWIKAQKGSAEFHIVNGLLYKRIACNVISDRDLALVVPAKYQAEVIEVAHKGILSAHGGVSNTEKRLLALFYFPKMRQKVKRFVKSCHECQMTSQVKTRDRVPLQQMDVSASHAFEDCSIDIVGELPVTQRRNKYILVVVCNVTKFVHAMPLTNIRSETIAEKLIDYFSFVGLPKVLRSDNMSGFKSEVMDVMRQKLGIKAQYSMPWHHISMGSVERVNATIETALRKCLLQYGGHWDKFLSYVLFALREVPHASTGYSPAQLVFGHKFRGLLHVMRDTWAEEKTVMTYKNKSTADFLTQLSERIDSALRTAKANETEAKARMKVKYDKKAAHRELQVGDRAFLLLPTCANKLLATWRGPYDVIGRCENNNYEIQMGNRRAKFHINQLKKYEIQPAVDDCAMMVLQDGANADDLTQLTVDWLDRDERRETMPTEEIAMGQQLTAGQQKDVRALLSEFGDVLSDRIGRTHILQHSIELTDEKPVYQASYKIPETLKEKVKTEIDKMLAENIIQMDDETCWNNPLIVVKKPTGDVRIVHNFIPLNAKTINKPYPMQDVKSIVNRVANAKLLTKIDLNRSFFQIPLNPKSQPYTGFCTPWGYYSYKVLPMGLKCASFSCQKLLEKVIRGAHDHACVLVDDLTVFSKDFESHLKHVRDILVRLRKANLTANVRKCLFATNEMTLFGFHVRDGQITPDQDKIKAVADWKRPQNKKELRSF